MSFSFTPRLLQIQILQPPTARSDRLRKSLSLLRLPIAALRAEALKLHDTNLLLEDSDRRSSGEPDDQEDRDVEDPRSRDETSGKADPRTGIAVGNVPVGMEPDVIARWRDGRWEVEVNSRGVPFIDTHVIRTNHALYKQRFKEDMAAQEFLCAQWCEADTLRYAVRRRYSTLKRIAGFAVCWQAEFLERGGEYLRVLTYGQAAASFGCHPSTISRAVKDKWIATPRGPFALAALFGTRLDCQPDFRYATEAIQATVARMVQSEDKTRPLSDETLRQRLLDERDVEIPRRTVAQLRHRAGIPCSRDRRRDEDQQEETDSTEQEDLRFLC